MPIVFKSGNFPWIQGGKTTETFRSGLVKVTANYITPLDLIATSLASLHIGKIIPPGSYADGGEGAVPTNIFPDPSWSNNGDGMATIQVTSYGRARGKEFTVEKRLTSGNLIELNFLDGKFVFEKSVPVTKMDFICRYVLAEGEEFITGFGNLKNDFFALDGSGRNADYDQLDQIVSLSESIYYGAHTEVTAAVTFQPIKKIYETTTV